MGYDKFAQGEEREKDPHNIAKDIIEELKEEISDGTYKDMEEALEYIGEFIEPHTIYYSDCHEILKNYRDDTSHFEDWGKKGFDDIAQSYAYQAIESEVHDLLRE